MNKNNLFLLVLMSIFTLWNSTPAVSQESDVHTQPTSGPGSPVYAHEEVSFLDFAEKQDGYYLMMPKDPIPKEAPVVVFLHGYSAYNPTVYGKWIDHIVKQGNIVIFPRYQLNILVPSPAKFVPNTVTAVKDALKRLEQKGYVKASDAPMLYVGHSFGGVITANILTQWEELGVPQPKGAFLVSPGTGPFREYELDDYSAIPEDTKLLIAVSENDYVVGTAFGQKVFATATNTPERNLYVQYADGTAEPAITAGHLEVYAVDLKFDTGDHGYSYQRSKTSKLDAVNFHLYWRKFDALMDYTRNGGSKEYIFGNTAENKFMGTWPDGRKIKELQVITPKMLMNIAEGS